MKSTSNLEEQDKIFEEVLADIMKQVATLTEKKAMLRRLLYTDTTMDKFVNLSMSNPENLFVNHTSNNDLNYLLNEAKSQTKKSLEGIIVSHMFIENYQIDKNNYNFFPENYKSNNFSLDVCFISLPHHIIKEFERVLKKYQIFLTGIISSDYIYSLYPDDNQNITKFIDRLQEGTSKNEVVLRPKNSRKSGLFEKFFHLFS